MKNKNLLSSYFILVLMVLGNVLFGQTDLKLTIKDQNSNTGLQISCNAPFTQPNLILTASPETTKTTDNYRVIPQTTYRKYPINASKGLRLTKSDVNQFIKVADIGFDFCFYGKKFSQVVIGTNGVISFNLEYSGLPNYQDFNDLLPNRSLTVNAVFGSMQAQYFDYTQGSDIFIETIGTAPYRKFIISFEKAYQQYLGQDTECELLQNSTQIILHEGTNVIETIIEKKPQPCVDAAYRNALIGISNGDGSKASFPSERNTGVWEANMESWLFIPNGVTITPRIVWFNANNTQIGIGNRITVRVPSSDTYFYAKATYNSCGIISEIREDYNITFSLDYPTTKNYTHLVCSSTPINLQELNKNLTAQLTNSSLRFRYYLQKSDALNGNNNDILTFAPTSNQKFFVRVENINNSTCFQVAELDINFLNDTSFNNSVSTCHSNKENFLLSNFDSQIFPNVNNIGNIVYIINGEQVTNYTLVNGLQFFIKIPGCAVQLGPITVNLDEGPSVSNTVINYTKTVCDNNNDRTELYDWNANLDPIINATNAIIRYYDSQEKAKLGFNDTLKNIKEGIFEVYARVQDANTNCFKIVKINANITFNKIEARRKLIYYCYNGNDAGTDDFTINLNDSLTENMLINLSSVDRILFFKTSKDANDNINPITSYLVTDNLVNGRLEKVIWVRFEKDGCYTVTSLVIRITQNLIKNPIPICDNPQLGSETITLGRELSDKIKQLNNLNGTIRYFSDAGKTDEITNEQVTITTGNKYYVEFTSSESPFINGPCVKTYLLDFQLTPLPDITPVVEVKPTALQCDINADNIEYFDATTQKNNIYSGTARVSYSYFENYDSTTGTFSRYIFRPSKIPIQNNVEKVIFVRVNNLDTRCSSKSEIRVLYKFDTNLIMLDQGKSLVICTNSAPSFDLTQAIDLVFDQTKNNTSKDNITVTYFEKYNSDTGVLSNPIGNPTQYSPLGGITGKSVYLKVTSNVTGCFSVVGVLLESTTPIEGKTVTKYVCQYVPFDLSTIGVNELLPNYDPATFYDVSFYLTPSSPEIDVTQPFSPEQSQITYRVKVRNSQNNNTGCNAEGKINFVFSNNKVTISPPIIVEDRYSKCDIDNDGKETWEITEFKEIEKLISNDPSVTFEYYVKYPEKRYTGVFDENIPEYSGITQNFPLEILVKKPGMCPSLATIMINLKKVPKFKMPDYSFCPEESANIPADLEFLGVTKYVWTYPDGREVESYKVLNFVNIPGKYKLTAYKNNGCTYTDEFTVTEKDTPKIDKVVFDGNTAIIYATGDPAKKIWYSIALEGASETTRVWGTSNVFNNLPPGVHSFRVQYAGEECSSYQKFGLVLDMRKNIITPNDDGFNDKWTVKRLDTFEGQNSQLKIFDRYYNTIYEQTSNIQLEWDGKQFGRPVPTSTYWYIMKLPDGREFTGYIVVKNRD